MKHTVEHVEKVVNFRAALNTAVGALLGTGSFKVLEGMELPRTLWEWVLVGAAASLGAFGVLLVLGAWLLKQAFVHQPGLYSALLAAQVGPVLKAPSFKWLADHGSQAPPLLRDLQRRMDYWPTG